MKLTLSYRNVTECFSYNSWLTFNKDSIDALIDKLNQESTQPVSLTPNSRRRIYQSLWLMLVGKSYNCPLTMDFYRYAVERFLTDILEDLRPQKLTLSRPVTIPSTKPEKK